MVATETQKTRARKLVILAIQYNVKDKRLAGKNSDYDAEELICMGEALIADKIEVTGGK